MARSFMISNDDKLHDLLLLLRIDFIEQVKHDCFELENLFLTLISSKSPDVNTEINKSYRIIHNLKGAGGTHGLPLVTKICHLFEDLLSRILQLQSFDKKYLDKSLQLIDLLRCSISEKNNEESIITALNAIREFLREKKLSVMVIDSSRTMCMLLERAFSEIPVNLNIMNDGFNALSWLIHEPVDVIITSNNIGSLSGTAVVAAIRENNSFNSKVPVLFLSDGTIASNQEYNNVKFFKKSPGLITRLTAEVKNLLELKS